LELHRPQEWARLVPDTVEISSVREDSFEHPTDFAAIRKAMMPECSDRGREFCGPFADFGAFGRISSWSAQQLLPLGLRWDGNYCQLQAESSFSLMRLSTNRGAVWFKAVGEPNLREFPVTMLLARLFPKHVPRLLAARIEWNAWLAAESEGQELSSSPKSGDWCRAAESLAESQISSIPVSHHILGAGARDVRSHRLLELIPPFFSAMEETMEKQTKAVPLKLSRQEIGGLGDQVAEALERLEEAGIPTTLNHLDLNPGNIFVSGAQCTFLDWAEAAVGNPFLSIQYLREHFIRTNPDDKDGERLLRNAYLGRWEELLSRTAVETALHLAPLTAVFAYASTLWDGADLQNDPNLSGFLRSLVRRMNGESQRIAQCRTAQLCTGRSGNAN
jgi:hypothetical protein